METEEETINQSENEQIAETPQTASSEPVNDTSGMLTQEQLTKAVQRAKAQAKRQALREFEEQHQQKQNANQANEQSSSSTMDAMLAEMQALKTQISTLATASAENVAKQEFELKTNGLSMSESQAKIAKTLFNHDRESFDSMLADLHKVDSPAKPKTGEHTGIGTPGIVPTQPSLMSPHEWTRDDVESLRADGSFLDKIEQYRRNLPGGSGGLFMRRNRKK